MVPPASPAPVAILNVSITELSDLYNITLPVPAATFSSKVMDKFEASGAVIELSVGLSVWTLGLVLSNITALPFVRVVTCVPAFVDASVKSIVKATEPVVSPDCIT